MKPITKLFLVLFLFFGIITVPVTIYAASDNTNAVLPKNEVVNKDYFAAGETVTLSGTVNGDAYVAGGNVIVEGNINGDLLAAGGTVTIRGTVRDDARIAGGQIIVSGDIGRNLTTTGGSVTISDDAHVNGSLTAGAGSLSVFSPLGKGATIGAGQVTLGNTINGDVQAGTGELSLLPSAKINGDLTYWSDTNAIIANEASVSGNTVHHLPPKHREEDEAAKKTAFAGIGLGFTFFSFLAALLIGLLLITFAPLYTAGTAKIILQKPLQSLGIGFLSVLVMPFLFILLLITIIGIPLGFILLVGFFLLMYMAKIIVGLAIGQKIMTFFDKKLSMRWSFTIGLILYYILSIIPFIGFVFWIIAGLIGFGALLLQKKYVYTDLRKKRLI